jgi:hypothetical protein
MWARVRLWIRRHNTCAYGRHSRVRTHPPTSQTIMLWDTAALTDAKIPAGPRLLILNHLNQFRSPSSVSCFCCDL